MRMTHCPPWYYMLDVNRILSKSNKNQVNCMKKLAINLEGCGGGGGGGNWFQIKFGSLRLKAGKKGIRVGGCQRKLWGKKVYYLQGWEFAHRFSDESLVWVIRTKKWAICSFAHFWWATCSICSRSLISSERPEQIAQVAHFWWATWAIRSHCSFLVSNLSDLLTSLTKNEGMSESIIFLNKKIHIKHTKK